MVYFVKITSVFFCLYSVVIASDNVLNNLLSNGNLEFIDLSYSYDKNTVYWPTTKKFEFTKKTEHFQSDGSWYASNDFAASEHSGTHIDAPYHFAAEGYKVDEIPVERLIVPLIIADVSSMVNGDSNFVLYKHNLDYIINDNAGKPCLIIFKFGWSKFINDTNKYFGFGPDKAMNFPGTRHDVMAAGIVRRWYRSERVAAKLRCHGASDGKPMLAFYKLAAKEPGPTRGLSTEVAEWITTSYKNVAGIGVDTASVDPGSSTNNKVHKIISHAGLYAIENIKLDVPVPEHGCTAIAMPMKIGKGSGAPLRLVAVCPKKMPSHF